MKMKNFHTHTNCGCIFLTKNQYSYFSFNELPMEMSELDKNTQFGMTFMV